MTQFIDDYLRTRERNKVRNFIAAIKYVGILKTEAKIHQIIVSSKDTITLKDFKFLDSHPKREWEYYTDETLPQDIVKLILTNWNNFLVTRFNVNVRGSYEEFQKLGLPLVLLDEDLISILEKGYTSTR